MTWQLRRFESLIHEWLPDITRRLGMPYFDRYEGHTKLSSLTIGDAAAQSSLYPTLTVSRNLFPTLGGRRYELFDKHIYGKAQLIMIEGLLPAIRCGSKHMGCH